MNATKNPVQGCKDIPIFQFNWIAIIFCCSMKLHKHFRGLKLTMDEKGAITLPNTLP